MSKGRRACTHAEMQIANVPSRFSNEISCSTRHLRAASHLVHSFLSMMIGSFNSLRCHDNLQIFFTKLPCERLWWSSGETALRQRASNKWDKENSCNNENQHRHCAHCTVSLFWHIQNNCVFKFTRLHFANHGRHAHTHVWTVRIADRIGSLRNFSLQNLMFDLYSTLNHQTF